MKTVGFQLVITVRLLVGFSCESVGASGHAGLRWEEAIGRNGIRQPRIRKKPFVHGPT